MNQTTYAVDNSALLYLALMRKRHTNTYRFTMTMDHEVDPEALQQSMQCILTPRAGSPYNCAFIALNGRLTITFSRFCRQPELEAVFFAKLDEALAAV